MGHNQEELKSRIQAKKKKLEAELEEMKADAHQEAGEREKELREKLDALESAIKEGWENLSESTAAKINGWLR